MYLAMHTWMRAEPIEAAISRIGPLGYKALEISGEPERHNVDEVRALLSKHGIRCFGSVTLMLGERNLLAASEGLIPAGVEGITGDLQGLVLGKVPARTDDDEITLFKTVGMALSDVAGMAAAAAVAEAEDLGVVLS